MTSHYDIVREACIRAQSAPTEFVTWMRPIRLADVLLAMDKTIPSHCIFVSGSGRFYEGRAGRDIQLTAGRWNVRSDDLSQQSPKTLKFLADLLHV